jgi:PAS domain S-box-containing protein
MLRMMESWSPEQRWLFDNLPVGMARVDAQLTYRYVNAAYAATQGYAPLQLIGQSLTLGQPDWVERLTDMQLQAQQTHRAVEHFDISLSYPRQPDLHREWDVTLLPLFHDDVYDGFVLYLVDVTSRKQAEELEASEARLSSVLEVAADAILVIDEGGIIRQVNPAVSRIFGYSRDELRGQRIETIMPSPYREEHAGFVSRYEHTGVPHIIGTIREVQGRRKNGETFPAELSVAESRATGQRRVFVGIIRDITQRKRLEAELETARARLAALINTVPVPLYVLDASGAVSLYNHAAEIFYGDALRDNRLFTLTRLTADTRAPLAPEQWPIMRALREGRPVQDAEQILLFPDGREVAVLAHAAPIVVDGRTIAAVAVSQDLTALKAADRAKDEFLALITHELKSPLAAIISWDELALEDPNVREEALRVIQRSAQAQRRIIDDLLDISKVIYGKLALEFEPVDAWEVAQHAVEALRARLGDRGLTLGLEPPGAPLPVLADPVRLEQIVNNLLTNAMKFTPSGGRITVSGSREGLSARLVVRDTGHGIPPEQLPHVFERFQQLGRERASGGLGLGLALVKGLAELHGGRVEAFSDGLDRGSTFTVTLPLREEA